MKQQFAIVLRRSATKDMRRIPMSILRIMKEQIATLATNPLPSGSRPVHGYRNFYRIRIGNYRVIYEVAAVIRIVTIIRMGHRKDVYRKL